jgi:hypothetical protein
MMLSQELIAAIRRFFYVEHWKIGSIASDLNLHPDNAEGRNLILNWGATTFSRPLPVTDRGCASTNTIWAQLQ